MTSNSLAQIPQYFLWLLALLELVIGLYILVLNPWQTANRYTSALLLLIAAFTYSSGLLIVADAPARALLPGLILSVSLPAIQMVQLPAAIVIIKPSWQRAIGRWLWGGLLVSAVIPAFFAVLDMRLGTRLWFTGAPTAGYSGGFDNLERFTGGSLAPIVLTVSLRVIPVLTLLLLLFFAMWDRSLPRTSRQLARVIFIGTAIAQAIPLFLRNLLVEAAVILIPTVIYAVTYAFASFRQMVAERHLHRGSLQVRMMALSMVITAPLLIAVSIFVTDRAGTLLVQSELQTLRSSNRILYYAMEQWFQANSRALQQFAAQPEIASMDPARQQKALSDMGSIYPHFTAGTADLAGAGMAPSDGGTLTNFSSQTWFLQALQGQSSGWHLVKGVNGNQFSIIAGAPILDSDGAVAGVAYLSTGLETLINQIKPALFDRSGQFLVLDSTDKLVASSGATTLSMGMDLSEYPPLQAFRSGERSPQQEATSPPDIDELAFTFENPKGMKWRSHAIALNNGWTVLAQQTEKELLKDVSFFRFLAVVTIGLGIGLLLAMSWITIRQALRPISNLTGTVSAIAQGDLTRVALVESEDEIGLLARTFNSMTSQVRELVTTLERRVAERTRDLEQRALQLQVTAEVAGEAAAIRDLEQLLLHTVHLISDRFNFYHAGIFLLDETGKYAVLRAASSEGGQRMLERGHRLEVGQVGIVGDAASSGEAHIALDVGSDAVFFNNPDLPNTRSEMALPLKVHQRMIGVLDVQSTKSGAFTDEDISILTTLANQLALAIDNARLFSESQAALDQLRELYQQQVAQAWRSRLEHQPLAYRYDRHGVHPAEPADPPGEGDPRVLIAPILLRGQSLGALVLRRELQQPPWSPDETEMVRAIVAQVALTLENARLMEENRRRALNEQLIGHITARTQSLLDLEAVMKAAVQEIGQALGDARVQIRLVNGDGASTNQPERAAKRS